MKSYPLLKNTFECLKDNHIWDENLITHVDKYDFSKSIL